VSHVVGCGSPALAVHSKPQSHQLLQKPVNLLSWSKAAASGLTDMTFTLCSLIMGCGGAGSWVLQLGGLGLEPALAIAKLHVKYVGVLPVTRQERERERAKAKGSKGHKRAAAAGGSAGAGAGGRWADRPTTLHTHPSGPAPDFPPPGLQGTVDPPASLPAQSSAGARARVRLRHGRRMRGAPSSAARSASSADAAAAAAAEPPRGRSR